MRLKIQNRKSDYPKQVGANIRKLRLKTGLTIRAVAKMIDMKEDALGRIENGKVSTHITTLKAIADALSVEVRDFV